ncbi:hypothetical protein QO011_008381 [Labrys wisconsinensis]|uniref:Uncharacterized protein n=1 Tax=Labrys wisconsinensis TaxID=425677 RepID=A0ABU0JM20_9HYPH|nr:hypothetical protein [Labrys wisconsinensis]
MLALNFDRLGQRAPYGGVDCMDSRYDVRLSV